MKIFICFVLFVFFLIPFSASSQSGFDELDERVALLLDETDKGRFDFAFENWLQDAKQTLINIDSEQLSKWKPINIQSTWLPDSSSYLLYFVKQWEPTHFEFKFLVRFNYQEGTHVYGFSESINVPLVKKLPADTSFELASSFFVSGSSRLEILTLQGTQSGNQYFSCPDVKSLILFELLHDRYAVVDKKIVLSDLMSRMMILWQDNDMFVRDWSAFKRMSTLMGQKGNMRICTFIVPGEGFSTSAQGAVLFRDESKITVIRLNDQSDEIRVPERSRLAADKWFGAYYTELIETSYKNNNYYTLIGFKSNDGMVKTRVLDVMTLSGKKVFFGAPIFKQEKRTLYRQVFEYSSGANMMLGYDDKLKMIVFDHLAPSDPLFNGQYRFYGPDFSYDGYRFEKGFWLHQADLDLRNPKTK